ncbi:MAG TPA: FAD-dependent oxidoreductase [Burkholderiaceae bacterium]|nr:FAD-dependent oxidoreductase [Burkholderiaceae bacterium]
MGYPHLKRDADTIVVGAGIVGAACAHALAAAGQSVLVLDDRRGGATAAGMGHLVVMDDNPAELALSVTSLRMWKQWQTLLPQACAWHGCGTLWLASDDSEIQTAIDKQARLHEAGVPSELLSAADLRTREPALRTGLAGGLKVAGDAAVYAPNVVNWLMEAGDPATRIRFRQATVSALEAPSVRLSDGTVLNAQAVVLANGVHAARLCPDLPIRAKKGQLAITDRYPGLVHHQLVELGYVNSAHHATGASVAFNVQPRPTGQLLIGSSREFDDTSNHVNVDLMARMLRRAMDYLPGLTDCNATRLWTGLRAATPDSLPILGPHPSHAGLWLAVGHEGLGVTTAPASAHIVTALMTGAACDIEPTPYLAQRFAQPYTRHDTHDHT